MISVKVIADSVCGRRLTSLQCTYPLSIHAQLRTHRALSMSAQSSRAIPTSKLIEKTREHPVKPEFKKNQRGMQPGDAFYGSDRENVSAWWDKVVESCIGLAQEGAALGIHKQWVNRVLSPVAHMTSIVTATDWENLKSVRLRLNERGEPHAQDEMYELVLAIKDALDASTPRSLFPNEPHTPYLTEQERVSLPLSAQMMVSSARCARVSYLNHEGIVDIDKDLALAQMLIERAEWGPMEHPAVASFDRDYRSGNFRGFVQFRKTFPNENGDS